MKNKLNLFTALSLLLFSQSLNAQNLFKIGPSNLFNVSFWDEKVYSTFGGEIGYEIGTFKKQSLYLAGTFHYGKHISDFSEKIYEKDFLIGIQSDYRFHLNNRYDGFFIGVGGDAKLLYAYNYFEPVPGDPGIVVNIEVNGGFSLGNYVPLKKNRFISPMIYIGFNPTDQNEYELSSRISVTFGL